MTLRISAPAVKRLRETLLQADEKERVAFAYCADSGPDLLASDIHPVPDTEMHISTPTACRPADDVERRHVNQCTSQNKHLLVIHSHPFANTVQFSTDDNTLMAKYHDWLQPFYPDTHLLFGVLAQDGFRVKRATADGDSEPVPVTVLGDWLLDRPLNTEQVHETVSPTVNWKRYDRNIRAIGVDGQQALANTHVAVVGCGGVGSWLATGLARIGISRLTVIDPDDIEESNLPRLAGARPSDVGNTKVSLVQSHCFAANPDCTVTSVYAPVQDAADQLLDADLIVGCLDKVTPCYWLNEFAVRHLRPYIDLGVVIERDADTEQVTSEERYLQTIIPNVTGCFDCLKRGDPEVARIEQLDTAQLEHELAEGYIAGTDLTPEPAVLPLNLGMVSDGLHTVVDLVTGHRVPPGLLRTERFATERVEIITTPRESCLTCGTDGVLAQGTADAGCDLPDPETDPTDSADYSRLFADPD